MLTLLIVMDRVGGGYVANIPGNAIAALPCINEGKKRIDKY